MPTLLILLQATGPVLVKEFSMTMGSPRHVSFSPTSHGRPSQTSRGSTTSTLDCSLVALELGNDTGTPEVDDSAFSSPYVPVLPETNTTKEAFAVRFQQRGLWDVFFVLGVLCKFHHCLGKCS